MPAPKIRTWYSPVRGWENAAACLTKDPELFFPNAYDGPGRLQAEEARAICNTCPVRPYCLFEALQREGRSCADARDGIWGAKTPAERADLAGASATYRQRRSVR